MNASFGDIFNDGRLSIYKTNISEPGVLVQANDLWVPKARAAGAGARVRESRVDAGRRSRRLELGRAVRRSEQRRHARPVSGQRLRVGGRAHQLLVRLRARLPSATARSSPTPANWPPMRGRSLSGLPAQARLDQRRRRPLHRGRAGRRRHATRYDGRAVALADLSNRGVLDVIVANQRGPLLIYTNTVSPGRHWIAFELEGTASNRSAIGARVEVRVERPAAGAGGQRRQRFQRPEPAPAALRSRASAAEVDQVVDPLAVRPHARRSSSPAVDRLHRVKESGERRRAPRRSSWRPTPRQPAAAADPHHLHPDHGAPDVRHPRSLRAHRARDRHGDRRRARHWAASPTARGRTRRARTSRASASASSSDRRFCGRTSLPA